MTQILEATGLLEAVQSKAGNARAAVRFQVLNAPERSTTIDKTDTILSCTAIVLIRVFSHFNDQDRASLKLTHKIIFR